MGNNLQGRAFNVLLKTRHIKLYVNGLYLTFNEVLFGHLNIVYFLMLPFLFIIVLAATPLAPGALYFKRPRGALNIA